MLIRFLSERNHSRSVTQVRGLEHQVFHEIPSDHASEHKGKPANHKKMSGRSATPNRYITRNRIEGRVWGINAMLCFSVRLKQKLPYPLIPTCETILSAC